MVEGQLPMERHSTRNKTARELELLLDILIILTDRYNAGWGLAGNSVESTLIKFG